MRDLALHLPEAHGRDLDHGGANQRLHVGDAEGPRFRRHAASILGSIEGAQLSMGWGGGVLADVPAMWNQTVDHTATVTWDVDGLKFQAQAVPTTGDNFARNGLRAATAAVGLRWRCSGRMYVSSAANVGLAAGWATNTTATVIAANPTDGVYFVKPNNATGLIGRVVANGAAAVDLAVFNLDELQPVQTTGAVTVADGVVLLLGIEFQWGATAALSIGYWIVNGIETPMSAAQITALFDIFNTTPAVLSPVGGFNLNGTTQRKGVSDWFWWEVERGVAPGD